MSCTRWTFSGSGPAVSVSAWADLLACDAALRLGIACVARRQGLAGLVSGRRRKEGSLCLHACALAWPFSSCAICSASNHLATCASGLCSCWAAEAPLTAPRKKLQQIGKPHVAAVAAHFLADGLPHQRRQLALASQGQGKAVAGLRVHLQGKDPGSGSQQRCAAGSGVRGARWGRLAPPPACTGATACMQRATRPAESRLALPAAPP